MKIRLLQIFLSALIPILLGIQEAGATNYYVDSQNGDDRATGDSTNAWKTIDRVNIAALSPGDIVSFKRGGVYRGHLVPVFSGTSASRIIFRAYGTGPKPIFLGSYNRGASSDWTSLGGNIWSTGLKEGTLGSEVITNPGFETNTASWYTSVGGGAIVEYSRVTAATDTITPYEGIGAARLKVGGNNGNTINDVQFVFDQVTTKAVTWYKVSFAAKANSSFNATVSFFKAGPNYDNYILNTVIPSGQTWYSSGNTLAINNPPVVPITNTWQKYTLYIQTNSKPVIGTKGRLVFLLGNQLPENSALYLDAFSFKECATPVEYFKSINEDNEEDVGNIIFTSTSPISCGRKVWNQASLTTNGDFYYDYVNKCVLMYSSGNPATVYGDIELARPKTNIRIEGKSYLNFENLDLRYSGGGGILTFGYKSGTTNTVVTPSNINIRGVDISYVGGTRLGAAQTATVRAGNGVGFWDGANNIVVERCKINQVYDSGISPQGSLRSAIFNKLYFRNNIIDSCEQSFEIWQTAANQAISTGTSSMSEVYFDNNTCRNAGSGWSHNQRPDVRGVHLLFYDLADDVNFSNIYIRNNIFDNVTEYGIYCHYADKLSKITSIDFNCWNPGSLKPMLYVIYAPGNTSHSVTTYDWNNYRTYFNKDVQSLYADPLLLPDGSIPSSSPAKDAGADLTTFTDLRKHLVVSDFNSSPRPYNTFYDMGAFEFGATVLPVSLRSFIAKVEATRVRLKWDVSDEKDNDYYELERSVDGKTFKKIGYAKSGALSYTLYDDRPVDELTYYKLKQYDINGQSAELGVRPVQFGLSKKMNFTVFPNPALDHVYINLDNNSLSSIKTYLINMEGRIVHHEVVLKSDHGYRVNFKSKLVPGNYILKIQTAERTKSALITVL